MNELCTHIVARAPHYGSSLLHLGSGVIARLKAASCSAR